MSLLFGVGSPKHHHPQIFSAFWPCLSFKHPQIGVIFKTFQPIALSAGFGSIRAPLARWMDPILIADQDVGFKQNIEREIHHQHSKPVIACSEEEALIWLENLDCSFSGVFINPQISKNCGMQLISAVHARRIGTPLYYLSDTDQIPFAQEQLDQLAIQKVLRKPIKYADLISEVTPIIDHLPEPPLKRPLPRTPDTVDGIIDSADGSFIPIRAKNFLAGTKSFFDLYVRLGESKFIKILHAGEAFELNRIAQYIRKGMDFFYLKRESQLTYLTYCEQLTQALLKSSTVSLDVTVPQVYHLGELTQQFLKQAGVKETELHHVDQFCQNIQELAHRIAHTKHETFESFLMQSGYYEHGVATTMIASLFMQKTNPGMGKLHRAVGLAAFFHDIGLQDVIPPEIHEDESLMTMDQKKLYRLHPIRGAEFLSRLPEMEPGILQAVAQHHERRDGRGFPHGLEQGQIHRYAEIIGAADELAQWIARAAKNPGLDPFLAFEDFSLDRFSAFVADTYRRSLKRF